MHSRVVGLRLWGDIVVTTAVVTTANDPLFYNKCYSQQNWIMTAGHLLIGKLKAIAGTMKRQTVVS